MPHTKVKMEPKVTTQCCQVSIHVKTPTGEKIYKKYIYYAAENTRWYIYICILRAVSSKGMYKRNSVLDFNFYSLCMLYSVAWYEMGVLKYGLVLVESHSSLVVVLTRRILSFVIGSYKRFKVSVK